MRSLVRPLALLAAIVAVGAVVAVGWLASSELDDDDAAQVAIGALDSVGVDAEVTADEDGALATRGEHETEDGESVDAWFVRPETTQGAVELRLRVSDGRLVWVDDRVGADAQTRLLTDAQFDELAEYRSDPAGDRWLSQNLAGTVAAVVAAAVAVGIFVVSARTDEPAPADLPDFGGLAALTAAAHVPDSALPPEPLVGGDPEPAPPSSSTPPTPVPADAPRAPSGGAEEAADPFAAAAPKTDDPIEYLESL